MISIGKITNVYDKDDVLYADAIDLEGRNYKDALVYVPQGGPMNMPAELNYPCLIIKTAMAVSVIPLQVAKSPIGAIPLTHAVAKPGRVEVTTKNTTTIRDGLVKFVIAKLKGFVSASMLRLEAYINKHHFVIGNKLKFEIYNQAKIKTHTVIIDPESSKIEIAFASASPNKTKMEITPQKTKMTISTPAEGSEVEITPSKIEFAIKNKAKVTITSSDINFHVLGGAAFEGGNVLTGKSIVCPIMGSLMQFGNPTLTNKTG